MEPEYHCKVENDTFIMTFDAPRQLLLNPDWEALVWNECIAQAGKMGVITTGSILITATEIEKLPPTELKEGESLKERMERFMETRGRRIVEGAFMVQITATVQVGIQI